MKWSQDKVISSIKELDARGECLRSRYVYLNHNSLFQASFRYFGSWRKAIKEAGLDDETVFTRRAWNRNRIVSELRSLEDQGITLYASSLKEMKPHLYFSLVYYFGSFREALAAAGIPFHGRKPRVVEYKPRVTSFRPEGYFNIADVARELRVSRQAIHSKYVRGKLPKPDRYYDTWRSGEHPLWAENTVRLLQAEKGIDSMSTVSV